MRYALMFCGVFRNHLFTDARDGRLTFSTSDWRKTTIYESIHAYMSLHRFFPIAQSKIVLSTRRSNHPNSSAIQ